MTSNLAFLSLPICQNFHFFFLRETIPNLEDSCIAHQDFKPLISNKTVTSCVWKKEKDVLLTSSTGMPSGKVTWPLERRLRIKKWEKERFYLGKKRETRRINWLISPIWNKWSKRSQVPASLEGVLRNMMVNVVFFSLIMVGFWFSCSNVHWVSKVWLVFKHVPSRIWLLWSTLIWYFC